MQLESDSIGTAHMTEQSVLAISSIIFGSNGAPAPGGPDHTHIISL